MKTEIEAWIFLNRIPELGPVRFHRLLRTAQSAVGVLELPVSALQAAEVPREMAERWHRAFRDPEIWRRVESDLGHGARGTFQIKTEMDADYPSGLRPLLDRPPVLYVKGRWPAPDQGIVGLVGTRHPSPYGLKVAERLVIDLALQKMVTISGLARGIDTCVHQTSLKAGCRTMAVLGCGLGQAYPRENLTLQNQIAEDGTLITEFPYETGPDARHFPRRNRIISGLSQGVVVIEAGERSGALITARYAAEQGRDVFAVPGSIFHPNQGGCHRLIKEGAKLVETAGDILEEWGISSPSMSTGSAEMAGEGEPAGALLAGPEKDIYGLLSDEPLSIDELRLRSSLRFDQIANSLLTLELKGVLRALPGQRYARKN